MFLLLFHLVIDLWKYYIVTSRTLLLCIAFNHCAILRATRMQRLECMSVLPPCMCPGNLFIITTQIARIQPKSDL